jgi:hypothetical protein
MREGHLMSSHNQTAIITLQHSGGLAGRIIIHENVDILCKFLVTLNVVKIAVMP